VVRHAVEWRKRLSEQESLARWGIPVGIAAVVAILVVVALVRDPVQLDPDSPEGTVQEYLQAISDERWEDAHAVLDPEGFAECNPSDIASNAPGQPFTASLQEGDARQGGRIEEVPSDDETTATTTPPDEERIVEVTLRFGDTGPLGSGWTTHEVFEVVSRDGFWWISGDPWPYFGWSCR